MTCTEFALWRQPSDRKTHGGNNKKHAIFASFEAGRRIGTFFIIECLLISLLASTLSGNPNTYAQGTDQLETDRSLTQDSLHIIIPNGSVSGKSLNHFEPTSAQVFNGSAVTWENLDTVTHTATSDDDSFDTGAIVPSESKSVVILSDQDGDEIAYHCDIHPFMTATLEVSGTAEGRQEEQEEDPDRETDEFEIQPDQLTPSIIADSAKPAVVQIEVGVLAMVSAIGWQIDTQLVEEQLRALAEQGRFDYNDEEARQLWFNLVFLENPSAFIIQGSDTLETEAAFGVTGSGFIATPDGYVVTNAHVVSMGEDEKEKGVVEAGIANLIFSDLEQLFEEVDLGNEAQNNLFDALFQYYRNTIQITDGPRSVINVITKTTPDSNPGGATEIRNPASIVEAALGEPIPGKDVAVLKIDGENLATLPIGDERALRSLDEVIVIGFPGAVSSRGSIIAQTGVEPSILTGEFSGFQTTIGGWRAIQVQAPIAPGNSGGPALDPSGNVIGLATFGSRNPSTQETTPGFNFLVPMSIVMEFLELGDIDPVESDFTKMFKQALILYSAGEYESALEILEELGALLPNNPYVADYLSRIEERLGRAETSPPADPNEGRDPDQQPEISPEDEDGTSAPPFVPPGDKIVSLAEGRLDIQLGDLYYFEFFVTSGSLVLGGSYMEPNGNDVTVQIFDDSTCNANSGDVEFDIWTCASTEALVHEERGKAEGQFSRVFGPGTYYLTFSNGDNNVDIGPDVDIALYDPGTSTVATAVNVDPNFNQTSPESQAPAAELLQDDSSIGGLTDSSPSFGSSSDTVVYQVHTEQREGAFRILVPAGWTAQSAVGLSPELAIRTAFLATSPDGSKTIGFSRPTDFTYMPPHGIYTQEGQIAYNGGIQIYNYRTADQFVQEILMPLLATTYPDLELVQQMGLVDQPGGSAGFFEFSHSKDGTDNKLQTIVTTYGSSLTGQQIDVWHADVLAVGAPASEFDDNFAEMAWNVQGTMTPDPVWVQNYIRQAGVSSAFLSQSYNDSFFSTLHAIQQSQANLDTGFQGLSDATLGVHGVTDPNGTPYTVPNSHSSWWVGSSTGNLYGSNTGQPPADENLTPLQ